MRSTSVQTRIETQSHKNHETRAKRPLVRLSLGVKGFKPQPDPFWPEPRSFRMRVACSTLPHELLDWGDVNLREQRLGGPVTKAITETWDEYPEEFHRCSRGALLFARDVAYDSAKEIVTIGLGDHKLDGVGDGAHLLRLILENLFPALAEEDESDKDEEPEATQEERKTKPIERYVELEVMVGLTRPEMIRIVAARNRSRNVPDYAVTNLEGKFDGLKQWLRKANKEFVEKWVAFKPNETIEGTDQYKPISLPSILQLLTCMDIDNFDDDRHPIEAYKNRGKAPEFFVARQATYEKMQGIAGDVLKLYDRIRQRVPEAYNNKGRRWGHVIKDRVGTGVKEELYYLDATGKTVAPKAPAALFYPMLSAFRAALREKDGRYAWVESESPAEWPDEEFDEVVARLALKIARAVKGRDDNMNAVGRDNEVWDSCYRFVKGHLLETGRVQPKSRRR